MTTISNIVFLTVLAVIVYCGTWSAVEGRYLPTRPDESRKEQMKDILRAILDLGTDDRESYVPSAQFPYERHAKKRSIVEPEQVIVPDNSQASVPRSAANH